MNLKSFTVDIIKNFNWDIVGIFLSIGCMIHCALLPAFITFSVLNPDHTYQSQGITIILILLFSAFGFLRGFIWHHHDKRVLLFFITGVVLFSGGNFFLGQQTIWLHTTGSISLMAAHIYNALLCKKCNICSHH